MISFSHVSQPSRKRPIATSDSSKISLTTLRIEIVPKRKCVDKNDVPLIAGNSRFALYCSALSALKCAKSL